MSEFQSLTDRINALDTEEGVEGNTVISRDEVLAIVKDAVPVEIDPTMYTDEHVDEQTDKDRKILAVVSTVYNLLADTSAEFAAQHVRAKMEARGMTLMTDEEMFTLNRELGRDGATSYRDLAHHSAEVVMAIGQLFDHLEHVSTEQAELGLQLSNSMLGQNPEDMSLEQLAAALGITFDRFEEGL